MDLELDAAAGHRGVAVRPDVQAARTQVDDPIIYPE